MHKYEIQIQTGNVFLVEMAKTVEIRLTPSEHFCGQRNATLGVQVKIWLRLVENGKFLSQQGRRKAISR
uniref:Uncharacterized protein n=1 Tax=Anguilla anguilla TaxID=7936 RepID=A0A0E9R2G1_ANGAN